jgi:hypothetical protein
MSGQRYAVHFNGPRTSITSTDDSPWPRFHISVPPPSPTTVKDRGSRSP